MNAITINTKNHTIELSKAFSKVAAIFGTDEYNQLQTVRRDYPNYRVVTLKQKGTGKAEFAKLSFDFMDKYVKAHATSDELKAEYLDLRGLDTKWEKDENGLAEDYQIVKDWFLNAFPEFEQAHNKRLELLNKIQDGKKARLDARKTVALTLQAK